MAQLLEAWRHRSLPVIHVQHCSTDPDSPLRPDLPGSALKEATGPRPGELVIQKQVNSAFIQTPLEAHLRRQSISALVVVGFTTDHCVSTTVRMAANLGFTVFLVAEATATFDREGVDGRWYPAEAIHQIHLASLHGEFCTVLSCADVIGGLEGGSAPSLPTGSDPWRDCGFPSGRSQLRLRKSSSSDPERRLRQEPGAPSGVAPTHRAARRSHPGRLSTSGSEPKWVHLKRPSMGAIGFPYVPRRNPSWGFPHGPVVFPIAGYPPSGPA